MTAVVASGPIRTAVLGYGLAGRVFHCPFIAADPHYRLDAIVTANEERARAATADHPGATVLGHAGEVFERADALDLVVIGTPPATHVELATRALEARLAVVVDKPFCATHDQARGLVDLAEQRGAPLTVFHNRRWDGDFLTLRGLLDNHALGMVHRFESRFERWNPAPRDGWKGTGTPAEAGGILYDLGSHLVDQALQLFGPVEDVHGELAGHGVPAIDADAFVSLRHASGVRSHLWMSQLVPQLGPRFRVLGSEAGFTKWGLDPQEPAIAAGVNPSDPRFGWEPEDRWGMLGVDGSLQRVPTARGSYASFYAGLAAALLEGAPLPVDPADAVEVVRILEEVHRGFPIR